jgi:hypothetical protein
MVALIIRPASSRIPLIVALIAARLASLNSSLVASSFLSMASACFNAAPNLIIARATLRTL